MDEEKLEISVMNYQPFLNWINNWYKNLDSIQLSNLSKDPKKIAFISVDMIEGFVREGNLSSPRIKAIIPNVVELFGKAYDFGVRNFVLIQDTHNEKAKEFSTYPRHAVAGSKESETIVELKNLQFANLFKIIEKNSISPSLGTDFDKWLEIHKEVDTFIVVGDCTDICVYLTAMHLKVWADAFQLKRKIIVPENCVQTYSMSVDMAEKLTAIPHDGDFLHKLFLYHMGLNGIEIVKNIK